MGYENNSIDSLAGTPTVSTPTLLAKMMSNATGTPRESKHLVKLKEEAARVAAKKPKVDGNETFAERAADEALVNITVHTISARVLEL